MNFLLDTTAFSDLMREHPGIDVRLETVSPVDRIVICSVVRGEILYGIGRLPEGKRQQNLAAKAIKLFGILPCEPIPEKAGDFYAEIKRTRQLKGLTLDENDLWIAATALALGATLISRDNDFQNLEGLKVENWSA
jgi:predicted nucleic acid-binding protein